MVALSEIQQSMLQEVYGYDVPVLTLEKKVFASSF